MIILNATLEILDNGYYRCYYNDPQIPQINKKLLTSSPMLINNKKFKVFYDEEDIIAPHS